jgi:hypothetical protein
VIFLRQSGEEEVLLKRPRNVVDDYSHRDTPPLSRGDKNLAHDTRATSSGASARKR